MEAEFYSLIGQSQYEGIDEALLLAVFNLGVMLERGACAGLVAATVDSINSRG